MSSISSQRKKGDNEPWRSKERHYCPLCNAWMGSDRHSILLHENGKKHREAVENDLKRRRDEKSKKEKEQKELEKVFAKVEAAAASSFGGRVGLGIPASLAARPLMARPMAAVPSQVGSVGKSSPVGCNNTAPRGKNKENKSARKEDASTAAPKPKQVSFDPNVGHYEHDGVTYLEGRIYAQILEENMPVQLWMGSPDAADEQKRDLRNFNYWKTALLAKVTRSPQPKATDSGKEDQATSCHVSYLQQLDDEDETMESNVPPHRIRLIIGSDPSIPATLEEAQLALMGGEQIIHLPPPSAPHPNADLSTNAPEIDENTGLTSWNTVSIRKVSHHYEEIQERKRKRQQQKEEAEKQQRLEKEIQARKMEEAKYANAHDSALGAYNVWSSANDAAGGGGGASSSYKGVDITKEAKLEVADSAKSLAKGMGKVAFKRKGVGRRKNVRTTSADDD